LALIEKGLEILSLGLLVASFDLLAVDAINSRYRMGLEGSWVVSGQHIGTGYGRD
jgi:hypothetical protein